MESLENLKIESIDLNISKRFILDSKLYSLSTIQAALVPLNQFASFDISLKEQSYIINIEVLDNSVLQIEEIYHIAKNNVIHESLRETIYKETENERNLILAYTFSNTKLVG